MKFKLYDRSFILTSTIVNGICSYFSLGSLFADPLPVSLARSNEVWQLKTETGLYALKRVTCKGGVYEETEKIARNFKNLGLPVITAHPKGIYQYGPYCFQLFNWINGRTYAPSEVLPFQAEILGTLLAYFNHNTLNPSQLNLGILNDYFYNSHYNKRVWIKTIRDAALLKIREYQQLQFLAPLLMRVAEIGSAAMQKLSFRILSHRDIRPSNVIWKSTTDPIIIDWELAGLINPTIELIGMAFDWSIVNPNKIDLHRYQRVIRGYLCSGGILNQITIAFDALMSIWLNWLLYNLKRYVRGEGFKVAECEVVHTLLTFKEVYKNKEKWLSLLK